MLLKLIIYSIAMDVLGKLCIREDNDEVIETALEIQGYESLLRILIIPDVQVCVCTINLKNVFTSSQ